MNCERNRPSTGRALHNPLVLWVGYGDGIMGIRVPLNNLP
jgi:hypothetical protein